MTAQDLHFEEWQVLSLNEPLQVGRPPFLTAASGLVQLDGWFYVIADDEDAIFRFRAGERLPGQSFPLTSRTLPVDVRERKKEKLDFEALTRLDHEPILLAVPSGSRPTRQKGYLISAQDPQFLVLQQVVDFSPLYQSLKISALNIEGAAVTGTSFVLAHRGNSVGGKNFLIQLPKNEMITAAKRGRLNPISSMSKLEIDLGSHQNLPFGFTDIAAYEPDQLLYLAAAEDTDDPYEDGGFEGAQLGCVNLEGRVLWSLPLSLPEKPEGLWIEGDSVWIVTDADDPTRPSKLYRTDRRQLPR
ncbi:MAG: DUF6929 family protein [Bdellovibrionales bacterium]